MKNVKLIALDMDGTLLDSASRIPQENVLAIREADAAGIRVCIATGRMLEDASWYIHKYGLPCMMIGANGARACSGPLPEGQVTLRMDLTAEEADRVLDLLLPFGFNLNGFEDGIVNTVRADEGWVYHLVARGLSPVRYGEEAIRAAAHRGLMKIYAVSGRCAGGKRDPLLDEAAALLAREMPQLQVTSSHYDNLEIISPHAGKGVALAGTAAQMGLTRENVMAVGDATNDLSMLKYAAHSVAMGNASDELKAQCRYTTETCDACGVAKIIRRVIAAKEDAV